MGSWRNVDEAGKRPERKRRQEDDAFADLLAGKAAERQRREEARERYEKVKRRFRRGLS